MADSLSTDRTCIESSLQGVGDGDPCSDFLLDLQVSPSYPNSCVAKAGF